MSVEAKTKLINNIKKMLSDKLTVDNMESFLGILSDEMIYYDVEIIQNRDDHEEDVLSLYLDALRVEGRSPKTIKQYERILKNFLKEIKLPSQKVTVFNIRNFFTNERGRGVSDTYVRWKRNILNTYYNWLVNEKLVSANPLGNIGKIKVQKKVLKIFSDVEIELMKNACNNVRDEALISFLLATGVRVDELHKLNRDDVNFDTFEVKVLGKGNKERVVYINAVVAMQLKKYFAERKDLDPCLFRSKYGRLTSSGAEDILKRLEERSAVDHIHPHKFRRTFATKLIKNGMPIEKVSYLLGHEKIETTMKYIVLDDSDIKYAYNRFAS